MVLTADLSDSGPAALFLGTSYVDAVNPFKAFCPSLKILGGAAILQIALANLDSTYRRVACIAARHAIMIKLDHPTNAFACVMPAETIAYDGHQHSERLIDKRMRSISLWMLRHC